MDAEPRRIPLLFHVALGLGGLLLSLAALVLLALVPSLLIRALLAPLNPAVVFCGPGGQKRLALSIDDGPSGSGSQALLALLQELGVPATFFLIGSHLERDPDFPRLALQQGHDLGNHLWRDACAAELAEAPFWQELHDTERLIERAAARVTHLALVPPWSGLVPWRHAPAARVTPLPAGAGSIFPWDTFRPPLWFVRWFVRLNAHPGGILVLHDTPALSGRTLESLRWIVPELRQRGYRFVPLEELLDPAS